MKKKIINGTKTGLKVIGAMTCVAIAYVAYMALTTETTTNPVQFDEDNPDHYEDKDLYELVQQERGVA